MAQESWEKYKVDAVKVEQRPRIDGVLDEAVWQGAAVIDQFVQQVVFEACSGRLDPFELSRLAEQLGSDLSEECICVNDFAASSLAGTTRLIIFQRSNVAASYMPALITTSHALAAPARAATQLSRAFAR